MIRAAVIVVTCGWAAVIAMVVVDVAIAHNPPPTALTGASANRPAADSAHRIGTGHRMSTANRISGANPASQAAHSQPTRDQLSETSTEFKHNPPACGAPMCAKYGCKLSRTAVATTTFNSVQAAFDGNGVSVPDAASSGNFDCGGFSYQAQQLAANGFGPGDQVAVAGRVLTLPRIALGAPDEISAKGQVIRLDQATKPTGELGFLGAGEFGTQSGTVTITYVGGSRQTATLRLADWYSDVAPAGSVIAASGLWNVPPVQARYFGPAPVSVYYTQIAVDASKRIESVTLPRDPNIHIFDIGVPTPASYRTVSSAYNDTGLVSVAAAGDGNFDGGGHSYDSDALAAKGLTPGATVTASGVRFTWPGYGPGLFDNIRTQGQTVNITSSGRVLGFLGAATLGTQRGSITIHYSDGSSQYAVISFADWTANHAAAGGTIVATVPMNRIRGAAPQQVSVYSATVPLEAGKTMVAVTLPVNIVMHVFAIAEGA